MSAGDDEPRRFPCTVGGDVAAGRRRLALLLLGLAALMAGIALAVWIGGRRLPAVLAAAVAGVAWTAWRMSGDSLPLWVDLAHDRLDLQLRRGRVSVPLPLDSARRLSRLEREHLRQLATAGGIVAGAGGFESRLLGEFDLYLSDLDHALLLEAGERRLVVSPDDPDALLRALGRPARPSLLESSPRE